MAFGALRAVLELDNSDFKSSIEDSQDEMDSFGSQLESVGQRAQRSGALLTGAVTAPLSALGIMSVQTASDMEEMQSRFEQVFQDSADDVEQWAEIHADEIGRSSNQLQTYTANFGSLLNAMDATEQQSVDMSKELTTLTADLASFNDQSEEQVQQNLESALSGQSRAVRKYGVDLSAARVEQQLMNDGLAESREEASQAELAQARLNAIMEQTEDAQGDAARTSDDFANQVRALNGDTEELRAEIGEHLLPAATSLVGVLSNAVGWFGGLSDTTQKAIIGIGGVATVTGPALVLIGTLATNATAAAGALGTMGGAAMTAGGRLSGALLPSSVAASGGLTGLAGSALTAQVAILGLTAPVWSVLAAVGALGAGVIAFAAAYRNNWGNVRDYTEWAIGPIINGFDWLMETLTGVEDTSERVADSFGDFVDWILRQVSRIPGIDLGEDGGLELSAPEADIDGGESDPTDGFEQQLEDTDPLAAIEDSEDGFDELEDQTEQSVSAGASAGIVDGIIDGLETDEVEDHLQTEIESHTEEVGEMEDRLAELEGLEERDVISDRARQELENLREEVPDAQSELEDLEAQFEDVQAAEDIEDIDVELAAEVAEGDLQDEMDTMQFEADLAEELGEDVDMDFDRDEAIEGLDADLQQQLETDQGDDGRLEQVVELLEMLLEEVGALGGAQEIDGTLELDGFEGEVRGIINNVDRTDARRNRGSR